MSKFEPLVFVEQIEELKDELRSNVQEFERLKEIVLEAKRFLSAGVTTAADMAKRLYLLGMSLGFDIETTAEVEDADSSELAGLLVNAFAMGVADGRRVYHEVKRE